MCVTIFNVQCFCLKCVYYVAILSAILNTSNFMSDFMILYLKYFNFLYYFAIK